MGKPANNNDVPTEAVSGATLLLLLLRMMWLAVAVEVVAIALGSWTLAAAIPIAMYLTLKFIQVPNTLEFVSNPTPLEFLLHGLLTPLYKRYKSGHALPVISSATHLQADPKAFEKYCELTGFKSVSLNAPGVAGSLFMQALNISMCGAIVAHPNFPFGALGLIHIRNTIRQTEEVDERSVKCICVPVSMQSRCTRYVTFIRRVTLKSWLFNAFAFHGEGACTLICAWLLETSSLLLESWAVASNATLLLLLTVSFGALHVHVRSLSFPLQNLSTQMPA
eukprot:m.153383 g.153383  ORF g.153383 m.153383 type:complete len:279 (+) comp14287_c3_seq1:335-1171(+)